MRYRTPLYFLIFLLSYFLTFLLLDIAFAGSKINLPNGREYNLGELEEGRLYNQSFFVGNTGDSPLEVKVIKVGCGCTTIVHPKTKISIPANEAIEVKYTFNTEGMEGLEQKYIYIDSDDPDEPSIKITLNVSVKRSHQASVERFLSFGLFTVLGAGLIDGINPCAFTVLVFFISFLNFVGYRRRELLILGGVFILSVFLTYILIGIGLFKFVQSLESFSLVSNIVYKGIAGLSIVLGLYSVYDWYIYKKTGNPEEVKLKLPNFIKLKIQKIIQNASRNRSKTLFDLSGAVFVSGFAVSLLESVCTGQTYVPTISYVLRTPHLRSAAMLNLVLYNLMFILPLTLILGISLTGVTSEVFSKWTRGHLGKVKLLTAALFFLLGILLLLAKGGTR